jgi:hypothetical protein
VWIFRGIKFSGAASDGHWDMPNSPERRHAPRYELIAQANVASGDEAYLLPVRNISMTGAFLEGSPAEHPDLTPGVELEVAGGGGRESGKAPRAGGFGIVIEPLSKEDGARLQILLGRLSHVPPPRPASLRA